MMSLVYILVTAMALDKAFGVISQDFRNSGKAGVQPWNLPDEQRLVADILIGYDPQVRPVVNNSDRITVFIGMNLIQVFDLDEKNQVIIANIWLDQEWNDQTIRWDPVEYNKLDMIRIPSSLIWLPDVVLYNNAEEFKVTKIETRAMVRHDGNVFLPIPTKIISSCKIEVTYFPFDEQLCKMKYGSWTYDGWKVDITNRTVGIDTSNFVPNGEWDVIGTYQHRHLVFYSCCLEPYSDVTFYIHLRRKALYYVINVFFASTIMCAMTILVFLLPADSHQKITLGITTLLSYSVFTLAVVQKLPETSEYLPLINVYLASVLSVTSITILNTVVVLTLHHRPPSSVTPVPRRVKFLFFNIIGRIVCIHEPQPVLDMAASLASTVKNMVSIKTNAKKATNRRFERRGATTDEEIGPNFFHPAESIYTAKSTSAANQFLITTRKNQTERRRRRSKVRFVDEAEQAKLERSTDAEDVDGSADAIPLVTLATDVSRSSSPPDERIEVELPDNAWNSLNNIRHHGGPMYSIAPCREPLPNGSKFVNLRNSPLHSLASNSSISSMSSGDHANVQRRSKKDADDHEDEDDDDDLTNKSLRKLQSAVKALTRIVHRHLDEQKAEECLVQWQHLALIVDRVLFIFYLGVTVGTTLFIAFGPRSLQENISRDAVANMIGITKDD